MKTNNRTGSTVTPEQYQALVELMVIAACVDGEIAPSETQTLVELIRDTPGYESFDNRSIAKLTAEVSERVAQEGIEARLQAIIQALGDRTQLREEAYVYASLFTHFDSSLGEEETAFLETLRTMLGIAKDRATHIETTMGELVRNRLNPNPH